MLALLHAEPGLSSAELARRIEVSAQTMSSTVTRLLQSGLVARVPHPEHGRILELELTPAGELAWRRCWALVGNVERRMLQLLDDGEREMLLSALEKMSDALGEAAPGRRRRRLARTRSQREARIEYDRGHLSEAIPWPPLGAG